MKNIQIYDNIFSHSFKSKLYKDIIARDYNIGWADTNIIEHRDKVFMYSIHKRGSPHQEDYGYSKILSIF